MKKSRFTETQIVTILKQADAGVPVKDICRQAGMVIPPLILCSRIIHRHSGDIHEQHARRGHHLLDPQIR